jgi:hypothetical protein
MNRNKSSESSGGGKMKSQELFSSCTMKNYVKHRLLNDDDDFEKSLYKKPNPIPFCDKNSIVYGKTISSPRATLTGEVKTKKNTGKTVSSSAATEPDSDDDFVPCTFRTGSEK